MKRVTMISARGVFVAVACAAVLAVGGGVSAKPGAQGFTAQQRAASDQTMRTGIASLQAASGALQSGNIGQTTADLQSAVASMQRALPIYNGPREWAVAKAEAALRELKTLQDTGKLNRGRSATQHVALLVSRATQQAEAAVSRK